MNGSCHDFCSSFATHVVNFSSFRYALSSLCLFHGHYFVHSRTCPTCPSPALLLSWPHLRICHFVIEVWSRVHLAVAVTGVFVQSVSTPILVVAVDKLAMYVHCRRAAMSSPPSSWAHRFSLPLSGVCCQRGGCLIQMAHRSHFFSRVPMSWLRYPPSCVAARRRRYLNLSCRLWYAFRLVVSCCLSVLGPMVLPPCSSVSHRCFASRVHVVSPFERCQICLWHK